MLLVEVVPCGPLARNYPAIKIMASSAADAIEGWSRQVATQLIKPLIDAVGFETEAKLRAPITVRRIELWPVMSGGGSFGRILLGIALVAIAVWNPGIGGMILSQAGVTAVASAGIAMLLGGAMSLFMKSPTISKEEDPEASKYIGSGKNTAAIGTIIGIGGGRTLIGGQYLSIQVNSSDLVVGKFPETPS